MALHASVQVSSSLSQLIDTFDFVLSQNKEEALVLGSLDDLFDLSQSLAGRAGAGRHVWATGV